MNKTNLYFVVLTSVLTPSPQPPPAHRSMNATKAVPFAHALSGTSERDNCNRVHNICPVSWERSSQSLPEPQTMEEHTE